MEKEYTKMTMLERQFHDACRRVCLPIHQKEIFNDFLNVREREIVEIGTKDDVEKIDIYRNENGLAPCEPRSDFDLLCGNGARNISRIAEHRTVSPKRLALDFALTLGLLNGEAQYRRMLKQFFGEEVSVLGVLIEFRDNTLYVDDVADGKFRSTKASRGDYVLRSFEEIGWSKRRLEIGCFKNRRALRDCVGNMNKQTKRLKFKPGENMSIAWELVDA